MMDRVFYRFAYRRLTRVLGLALTGLVCLTLAEARAEVKAEKDKDAPLTKVLIQPKTKKPLEKISVTPIVKKAQPTVTPTPEATAEPEATPTPTPSPKPTPPSIAKTEEKPEQAATENKTAKKAQGKIVRSRDDAPAPVAAEPEEETRTAAEPKKKEAPKAAATPEAAPAERAQAKTEAEPGTKKNSKSKKAEPREVEAAQGEEPAETKMKKSAQAEPEAKPAPAREQAAATAKATDFPTTAGKAAEPVQAVATAAATTATQQAAAQAAQPPAAPEDPQTINVRASALAIANHYGEASALWAKLDKLPASDKPTSGTISLRDKATALLGQALAAELQGQRDEARKQLERIVQNFATTPEAAMAKKRLEDLNSPLIP